MYVMTPFFPLLDNGSSSPLLRLIRKFPTKVINCTADPDELIISSSFSTGPKSR